MVGLRRQRRPAVLLLLRPARRNRFARQHEVGVRRLAGDGVRRLDDALGRMVPAVQARGLLAADEHRRRWRLAVHVRRPRALLLPGRTPPLGVRRRHRRLDEAERAVPAATVPVDGRRRRDDRGDDAARHQAGQDAGRAVPQVHDHRHVQVLPVRRPVLESVRQRRAARRSSAHELRDQDRIARDADPAQREVEGPGHRVSRHRVGGDRRLRSGGAMSSRPARTSRRSCCSSRRARTGSTASATPTIRSVGTW